MASPRSSRRDVSSPADPTPRDASHRRSVPERLASWIVLAIAAVTPWVAGAETTLSAVRWWLGGALVLVCFLVMVGRLMLGRRLSISSWAFVPSLFLIGCLGWWASQDELEFSTKFDAEHWAFLNASASYSIFQWPRWERLGFLASVMLGFLAVIELGRSENFRCQLTTVIGWCGVLIAIYALGMAHFGWPDLPWVRITDGPERFNVCFYHYSGPPACLNLAWPLLIFGAADGRLQRNIFLKATIVLLMAGTFPIWDSAAGQSIAAGLFVGGLAWSMGARNGWLSPKRVGLTLGAVFLAVFIIQGIAISRMESHTPDNWISARETISQASVRDAPLRTLAEQRGDRLVISKAPDRPSAWLAALRMAADFPVIGLGPGAWVKRSALYTYNSVVRTFFHYRQYAHHDLLQFAAEWGMLAAIAMLVLWVGGIWRALHRRRDKPLAEIAIVLALLGIALHSTVDFPLQDPALQLWTVFLLGLAWSGFRSKRGNAQLHSI